MVLKKAWSIIAILSFAFLAEWFNICNQDEKPNNFFSRLSIIFLLCSLSLPLYLSLFISLSYLTLSNLSLYISHISLYLISLSYLTLSWLSDISHYPISISISSDLRLPYGLLQRHLENPGLRQEVRERQLQGALPRLHEKGRVHFCGASGQVKVNLADFSCVVLCCVVLLCLIGKNI